MYHNTSAYVRNIGLRNEVKIGLSNDRFSDIRTGRYGTVGTSVLWAYTRRTIIRTMPAPLKPRHYGAIEVLLLLLLLLLLQQS